MALQPCKPSPSARALESFGIPALAGAALCSMSSLKKMANTMGKRFSGDEGTVTLASESFKAQKEALVQLMGVAASSPSLSPL